MFSSCRGEAEGFISMPKLTCYVMFFLHSGDHRGPLLVFLSTRFPCFTNSLGLVEGISQMTVSGWIPGITRGEEGTANGNFEPQTRVARTQENECCVILTNLSAKAKAVGPLGTFKTEWSHYQRTNWLRETFSG